MAVFGDFESISGFVSGGGRLSEENTGSLVDVFQSGIDLPALLCRMNQIRLHYKPGRIHLCSIINAKSGMCPEDCAYCSQSASSRAKIDVYPLLSDDSILRAYDAASGGRLSGFSVVTSGNCMSGPELEKTAGIVSSRANEGTYWCVSLGRLSIQQLRILKKSGVRRIHHNLETSRSFFPNICSTHSYEERIQTVRNAKAEGFEVCSGGLFGLGESWADRVELALEVKRLDVDSFPVNFLNPIAGTKLEGCQPLKPVEALKIIALMRLVLPDKDIIICGGRLSALGELQNMVFFAGANGIMTGDYLTTKGRNTDDDKKMIADLGLEYE